MKILILLIFLFSTQVFAHPVIYQDGWALSSSNMRSFSNNYLMYSFTSRMALGVEHWRFSKGEKNSELGLVKLNSLLWRKNGEGHQANLYLHTGAGVLDQEIDGKGTKGVGSIGLEADWETRTLYTSLKRLQFHAPGGADHAMTQGRIGFSPVEAPFENLQTWFMVQGMVISDVEDKVQITPMLRFFYQNVLWEVGSSTRGDWMLNLMVHL